jgi:hypothetical protein
MSEPIECGVCLRGFVVGFHERREWPLTEAPNLYRSSKPGQVI